MSAFAKLTATMEWADERDMTENDRNTLAEKFVDFCIEHGLYACATIAPFDDADDD